eukprot:1017518-Pleurochrysis_carterae.AAC.3
METLKRIQRGVVEDARDGVLDRVSDCVLQGVLARVVERRGGAEARVGGLQKWVDDGDAALEDERAPLRLRQPLRFKLPLAPEAQRIVLRLRDGRPARATKKIDKS